LQIVCSLGFILLSKQLVNYYVVCVMRVRAEKASDIENDEDDDSDSEVIQHLQAEKEKELKKSDFVPFYLTMNSVLNSSVPLRCFLHF